MIFRALLGLALVALYLPHDADLGLGRPGGSVSLPMPATIAAVPTPPGRDLSASGSVCEQHAQACAGGLALLDAFQATAIRGLDEVKAEIEASRQARALNPT